jgi:hypothetical protein
LRGDDEIIASTAKLSVAAPKTTRAAIEFVGNHAPHGGGNLIPALRAAFEQQADEIWLYSDGDVTDWTRVLAEVERLVKGRRVRINTRLQFANDADHEGMMVEIARKSGGICLNREGNPIDLEKVARFVPDPDAKPGGNQGVRLK